jgi:hypothetical protein
MTEAAWLTGSDPHLLLEFLRGRASERELRLFAVACSRRIWHWIDDLGRAAVELAEQYADGHASANELRAARLACRSAGAHASWYAAASDPFKAAGNAARSAQSGVVHRLAAASAEAELAAERAAQADLLREVFGNPFRPLSVEASWRTAEVLALARTIYDERASERMPALADLLEEIGCDSREILTHCRTREPHVRGCWVLDLLLEKR